MYNYADSIISMKVAFSLHFTGQNHGYMYSVAMYTLINEAAIQYDDHVWVAMTLTPLLSVGPCTIIKHIWFRLHCFL